MVRFGNAVEMEWRSHCKLSVQLLRMKCAIQWIVGQNGLHCCLAAFLALLTGSGCRDSPADIEFAKMVSETRAKYAASQVRDAVLPLLSTNAINPADKTNQLPRRITELPFFVQQPNDVAVWAVGSPGGERRGLAFVTGSGFGHWGIVVCPFENGTEAANTLHGKVIPWEDGVFFFKEW